MFGSQARLAFDLLRHTKATASLAAHVWPQVMSVAVAIPTERNSERCSLQQEARASGASELTVPAVIQVVDKLPLLGSGKTGYVAATALARESGRQSGSAPEQEVA